MRTLSGSNSNSKESQDSKCPLHVDDRTVYVALRDQDQPPLATDALVRQFGRSSFYYCPYRFKLPKTGDFHAKDVMELLEKTRNVAASGLDSCRTYRQINNIGHSKIGW